jgi:hypothetical protein
VKEWLYQLKGKSGENGGYFVWDWPPLFTGKVEAPDKKTAKELVEEEYGKIFPQRVLKKDLETNDFLLGIKEIAPDDHHTRKLFEVKTCKQCGDQFKMIEKYTITGPGGGPDFCCRECSDLFNGANGRYLEFEGGNPPVIYRVTNKTTGMCYIGKTRQVFTLRWYQHFFQGGDTKFHKAIKGSPVTDWLFEVVEIVAVPPEIEEMTEKDRFICAREQEWIKKHDSVANGYNTVGGEA